MIHLVVLGPSELARACMVAGLADAPGLRVEACASPVEHMGATPDMLLLQDMDEAGGGGRLAGQLRSIGRHWPLVKTMVLTTGTASSLRLCRASRVCACLPVQADIDQILAAIRIVRADLVIYPAHLLIEPVGPETRIWHRIGSRSPNGAQRPRDPR